MSSHFIMVSDSTEIFDDFGNRINIGDLVLVSGVALCRLREMEFKNENEADIDGITYKRWHAKLETIEIDNKLYEELVGHNSSEPGLWEYQAPCARKVPEGSTLKSLRVLYG